jgi:hypothetical protein
MMEHIISNPLNVTGMLNTFFVEIIDDMLNQNSSKVNSQLPKERIHRCFLKTVFLYSVTEYEIEHVSKSLKGKLVTGYDEIPEYLVKQYIKHKKSLVHIYNASLSSGILPDKLKTAKVIKGIVVPVLN